MEDQFGFRHLAQSMTAEYKAEAAQVAAIALLSEERFGDDARIVGNLTDWANFYRGSLGLTDRARDLLDRAEAMVRTCCGAASPRMERVLEERAWLCRSIRRRSRRHSVSRAATRSANLHLRSQPPASRNVCARSCENLRAHRKLAGCGQDVSPRGRYLCPPHRLPWQ